MGFDALARPRVRQRVGQVTDAGEDGDSRRHGAPSRDAGLRSGAGPRRGAQRRRGRVSERTALLVASCGALLAFLDATIINIAFPSIRESFSGASIGNISWVLNAYNIVFAAFMIVFGRIGDLIGRRRLYIAGTALFTVASAASALAPSVDLLVVARIGQALGASMLVPASLALVIEGFPTAKRAHAVGLWGAAAAVAAGLGPPLGGLLIEAGGWRWAFWVNLPLGIGVILLARRMLVESRSPGRRRMPDLLGAALLAGALALVTTAIIKGGEWGLGSGLLWATVGGSVVLGAAFVLSSRRHPSPILDVAMMRSRPFLVANVVTLVAGVGFYAYMLVNVLWLQYVWHYSVIQTGLALVPGALVAAVVAAALGPVAARHGFRWVIVGGFVVWTATFVWYIQVVGLEPRFLAEWLPGQVLSGIGVGATMPVLGSAALVVQPGGRFGTASAVVSSARQLGGVVGIAVLVVILGTPTAATVVGALHDGWRLALFCFAAGAVLTVLIGSVRGKTEPAVLATPHGASLRPPSAARAAHVEHRIPHPEESLYARLPAAARERLSTAGRTETVQAGQWIVSVGEQADSMFVLLSGRAEVVIDDAVVRELGPGAVIGELALLTGGTRSASVRARRDCRVLEVSRRLMDETMTTDVEALSTLVHGLARQLSQSRPPAARALRPSLVAVVGAGPGAPVAEVASMLHDGLAGQLRVTLLDDPTGEQRDRAERENDLVLVVATDADPQAAARCSRQADIVVLVARAGSGLPLPSAPLLSAAGALCGIDGSPNGSPRTAPPAHPGSARPELVLVGDGVTRDEVAAWSHVDPWRITRVSSSGLGVASSLSGLVDRLSGRSLGLVLGGGGARAVAHIGVLLELEAAGVRIDRVSGASIGSIIAALGGMGKPAGEIEEICYREWVRERPFSDFTVPLVSLTRGRRLRRALERNFGGHLIEELPLGFKCVSTDLLTRSSFVHRSGSLTDAVNASVCLPVLFPPIATSDRLLVDGGVLANLPVDALTERDEGPIVAVNISMGGHSRPRSGSGQGATPRKRPVRVPALGETLLRTLMIGGGETDEARDAGAWVVTPESMGVGLLEFHQFDRMVASGRAAARLLLEETGGDFCAVPQE